MPQDQGLMTPSQMAEWRDLSGLTIRQVSARSAVSVPQVCQFQRGTLALRPDQISAIKKVLVAEVRERQARIAELVSGKARDREAMAV